MMAATLVPGCVFFLQRDSNSNHLRNCTIRCCSRNRGGDKSTTRIRRGGDLDSDSMGMGGNLMLKTAWYASELLGMAASFIRRPPPPLEKKMEEAGSLEGDRTLIVEAIKGDFERSYFVTGALTLDAYEEDCEFADPAGSFKGLRRFKRNCTNFGSLVEKSDMKLIKWEDFQDKGIGHWRFSCTMAFPWKPILSATGYTEYYLSKDSGKVCRHIEHWNVPKMALFKQLLKPSRN